MIPTEIVLHEILPLCDIPEINVFRACGKSWQLSIDQHVVWRRIAENIGAPWIEQVTSNPRYYEHVKNCFYKFKNAYQREGECEPFFRSPTIQGFRLLTQLDRDLNIADATFAIWKGLLPVVEENFELDPPDRSVIGLRAYLSEASKFSEWIDEKIQGNKFAGFSLDSFNMRFLPPAVCKIALKRISLSGNFLSTLPDELGKNSTLQKLVLNENEFCLFPPCILRLTSLKVLSLVCNFLKEIPNEIKCLKNLRQLNISGNEFTEFPEEVLHFAHLEKLDLSYNGITIIPPEIKHLDKLACFKIHSNKLTEVPVELAQLPFLDKLHLQFNQISVLPEDFVVRSSSLRVCRLEGNPIQPIVQTNLIAEINEFVDVVEEMENEEEVEEQKEVCSLKRGRSFDPDSELDLEESLAKKAKKK